MYFHCNDENCSVTILNENMDSVDERSDCTECAV